MLVETETQCWAKTSVHTYIDNVLSGKQITGKYVRLACQRHLDDLENGSDRGLYFDEDAAQHIIDFACHVKHSKGKWAGQLFEPEPWEMFILWVVFGWYNIDDTRRFNIAYNEIARKNGKTFVGAVVGCYGTGFDDEPGAEVYSFATKEEQAKIVFSDAQKMTIKSGRFGGRATVHKKSISFDDTYSRFQPLGSDSKNQDGLNVHMAIADEVHAHRDSGMWDVIESAMGARENPLIFAITTAGFNKHSFCHEQRDYATGILTGNIEDDTFFAIIFDLDKGDDWADENVWVKANPNLGVSVKIKDMQRMCRKAKKMPTALNNFLVKRLNIWTTQTVRWMNMEEWESCNEMIAEEDLIAKPCFGGIDLSSNKDFTCWGKLFPHEGKFVYIPKLYIPKENAKQRQKDDNVPYLSWAEQGLITLTPGNVIDYDYIMADVWADCEKFDIRGIGFDRYNFEAIRQRLIKEGVPEKLMISFGQGFVSMSAPMKKLEEIVLSHLLVHNNHPVLNWMAGNVAASTDAAENIKPDKEESKDRIDGIVALIMALGLAITIPEKKPSVYETRGVLEI